MKKIFLLASIAMFGLASCDKDDDCNTDAASIAGTYRITAAEYKATSGSAGQDWYSILPACEKDDLQVLNANGTYEYQDAGTTCGGGYTGTWSLNGNNITIDGETGTIQSWNCKTLVVAASDVQVAGDKLTITYVKQ